MELAGTHAGTNKRLGMKLFILSDSLTFAAILSGYCYLRLSSSVWPHPFALSNIGYAIGMSLCLFASSLTMMRAVSAMRRGDQTAMRRWAGLTILGGTAFLVMHLSEWRRLMAEGIVPSAMPLGSGSQAFASTFFGITGLHMLHVLSGIVLLALLIFRKRATTTDVEISGFYWQFVDAVWVFVFALVYLPSIS
ncbi:MAG: cytochrome c oxidase subunit 3 [Acidobacteriota bacterium]